jgi:hypothetical protein
LLIDLDAERRMVSFACPVEVVEYDLAKGSALSLSFSVWLISLKDHKPD